MPDIISVLERAAAAPTRGPDVDGPRRRMRVRQASVAAGAAVVVAGTVLGLIALPGGHRARRVVVAGSPSTTAIPRPHVVTNGDASIAVDPGWYATAKPLAPWLVSPHELFSIATVPLTQSPLPGNQSACPSEIPKVAVDGIGTDGAYVWIGEWPNHWPGNEPTARPATSAGLMLSPGCELPRGLKSYIALLQDGNHQYSVTYVVGPATPPERRAEINRMLDSLRFSDRP